MKIAIIGAGFTGLTAGYRLAKEGHEVEIFEYSDTPGGLAHGFKEKKWKWTLEAHYHHLFKTDKHIQNLAKEIKFNLIYTKPKTSIFFNGKISKIDSPVSLMTFYDLPLVDRFKTGIVLLTLKLTNYWQPLENISVEKYLSSKMGDKSWKILWEPLMYKKFGKYSKKIPASWFWARIKSRTQALGYPEGGFKKLAEKLDEKIKKCNGKIYYNTKIIKIKKMKNKQIQLTSENNAKHTYDVVISTLPNQLFLEITKNLPKSYTKKLSNKKGIGATNLILSLKNNFFNDNTYWLNINDKEMPFLCIVEHTNFINSKKYNGSKLLYIGNYLETNNRYFNLSKEELVKEYLPHLKKINPKFEKKWITKSWLSKAYFAQPIITKKYSKSIAPIKTPIEGLYLANIQQVYPWDRGTNYAVELGEKVAKIVTQ